MARQVHSTEQLIPRLSLSEQGNDSSPVIDLKLHNPNSNIQLTKNPQKITSATLGSEISKSERMTKVL